MIPSPRDRKMRDLDMGGYRVVQLGEPIDLGDATFTDNVVDPLPDGVAAPGASLRASPIDHVHPAMFRVLDSGQVTIPANSVGFSVASGSRNAGEVIKVFVFVSSPSGIEYAEGYQPAIVVSHRLNHTGAANNWELVADNTGLVDDAVMDWAVVGFVP